MNVSNRRALKLDQYCAYIPTRVGGVPCEICVINYSRGESTYHLFKIGLAGGRLKFLEEKVTDQEELKIQQLIIDEWELRNDS